MNNKEEEMAEATAENKTETLNPPNALTVIDLPMDLCRNKLKIIRYLQKKG